LLQMTDFLYQTGDEVLGALLIGVIAGLFIAALLHHFPGDPKNYIFLQQNSDDFVSDGKNDHPGHNQEVDGTSEEEDMIMDTNQLRQCLGFLNEEQVKEVIKRSKQERFESSFGASPIGGEKSVFLHYWKTLTFVVVACSILNHDPMFKKWMSGILIRLFPKEVETLYLIIWGEVDVV